MSKVRMSLIWLLACVLCFASFFAHIFTSSDKMGWIFATMLYVPYLFRQVREYVVMVMRYDTYF